MQSDNRTIVMPLSRPDFKPFLLQALLDWCEADGCTPYMMVQADDACELPREYLNADQTIVFCVSSEATKNFSIDEDIVSFQARFGEAIRTIRLPIGRIAAVYPKENPEMVTYFTVTETAPEKKKAASVDDDDMPVFTKL